MPIGLLILTAIPTTIGVAQGITQDRRQRDAEAAAKAAGLPTYFSLYTSSDVKELDGKDITIRDGRLYIGGENHPFAGYLRDMLETEIKAMVTTTCNDPPAMGWVYVHAETHEVRVGNRAEASGHRFGVWGYENGLVMDGRSAFWAVEGDGGGAGEWGLYYLEDGDEVAGEGKAVEVGVRKTNISDLIPPKG
ncbi:unnamed protein product [Tuber aestivum]|uniref:Uncharacterized protein n=1 Tax=Tuber aestivum TaxID=59557 RepID=A0A292Q6Y2_9PEZI|nr:unnamed protein product [Tuber aestivum]